MVSPVRTLATLVVLGAAVAPGISMAEIYSGVSVGYSSSESQTAVQSKTGHPILMQVQLGHFFNDYIAIEGRYGQSLQRAGGIAVDDVAALLVKGNVPVTERTAIYALSGYSYSAYNVSDTNLSGKGVSFGIGVHYALSNKSAVTLETINYTADGDARLSSLNIGYQVRF